MRESEARVRLLEALERTPLPTGLPAMAGGPGPLARVRRPGRLDELELVKRATQGATLAEVSHAREVGWDAWPARRTRTTRAS